MSYYCVDTRARIGTDQIEKDPISFILGMLILSNEFFSYFILTRFIYRALAVQIPHSLPTSSKKSLFWNTSLRGGFPGLNQGYAFSPSNSYESCARTLSVLRRRHNEIRKLIFSVVTKGWVWKVFMLWCRDLKDFEEVELLVCGWHQPSNLFLR